MVQSWILQSPSRRRQPGMGAKCVKLNNFQSSSMENRLCYGAAQKPCQDWGCLIQFMPSRRHETNTRKSKEFKIIKKKGENRGINFFYNQNTHHWVKGHKRVQNNTTNLREERDFFLRQKFLQNFLYMLWYAFPVLVTLSF